MQEKPNAIDVRIGVKMIDPRSVEGAGASDDAMDFVAFLEEQVREVAAVLPGDSCDEGFCHLGFQRHRLHLSKHAALSRDQLGNALASEHEHLGELFVRKSGLFAGALQLDELPVFRRDHVEIDGDGFVFFVIQVNHRSSVDHAGADRGHELANWRRVELLIFAQLLASDRDGEARAGDRRGSCSAVGLKDIAIYPHGARSESFQIDYGAQGTANQPLDLAAAAVELCPRNVARLSRLGRIGKHGILRREPAAGHALLLHPARHAFLNHRAANHARVSHCDENGPARMGRNPEIESHGAEFVGSAIVGALKRRIQNSADYAD